MSHFYKHEDAKVVVLDQADVDFHINGTYADEGMEELDDTETFGSRICAEDMAMLGALYSRSAKGAMENIRAVKKRGSGSFMSTYYVGYGHGSIGKMGNTFVSFEGVSMLFAKELQEDGLYVGQETSTRYIDFLEQGFVTYSNKENDAAEIDLYKRQFDLYRRACEAKIAELKVEHPFDAADGYSQTFYDNAINAKAFDICRSLLPCGARTLVCIYGSIETIKRVLHRMIGYDALWPEVSTHARTAYSLLQQRYPNSFEDVDVKKLFRLSDAYSDNKNTVKSNFLDCRMRDVISFTGNVAETAQAMDIMYFDKYWYTRERKEPLPDYLGAYGLVQLTSEVDFGGWRDIQRHRKGVSFSEWPAFDEMHSFYVENLPADILTESSTLSEESEKFYYRNLKDFDLSTCLEEGSGRGLPHSLDEAYCVPMGHKVKIFTSFPIDNAVYVAELRSGKTVHPIVREWAIKLGNGIKQLFPTLPIFHDTDTENAFSIKRGGQTITEKKD